MNPAILLHVYNEQHPIHCKIPSNHCTIDTITALFLAKDYLNIFISTDGTIVRHISLYPELDDILNLSIHSIYYSVNTIVEGAYQPVVEKSETYSILYGELQDIKNDLRVQSSVTRDYIERVYPDKQMEVWIMFEKDIKGINHMEDMPCKSIHNYNYDWLLDNTDLINCIICRDKDVNQPVSEKFYCNAEATGSSEDRCKTHCIECIKYEKGMGSETFIAKWNKHIKGTSYPVAGDDKPTWLRITENLDVGGAAVMYERDNPNVPIVYTIDEFHALGMLPSNKLDKFCMVHVMDNEFLSKHVIDTPSDKSNIDLYNMDLHERIELEDNLVWVLKVPGGWVYESVNPSTNALASVFVPFNNEFRQ